MVTRCTILLLALAVTLISFCHAALPATEAATSEADNYSVLGPKDLTLHGTVEVLDGLPRIALMSENEVNEAANVTELLNYRGDLHDVVLNTDSGAYFLSFDLYENNESPVELVTLMQVEVKGKLVNDPRSGAANTILVSSLSVDRASAAKVRAQAVPNPAAYTGVADGSQILEPLFVLVNFADGTNACGTRQNLLNLVWDGTKNVYDQFQTLSKGKAGITKRADRATVNVAGPYTLTKYTMAQSCSTYYTSWSADIAALVKADGYNMSMYSTMVLIIPVLPYASCSWAGLATLSNCVSGNVNRPFCTAYVGACQSYVLTHEMGHNMLLEHSGSDDNDDGVYNANYVYTDYSCLMGSYGAWNVANAAKLYLKKWLDTDKLLNIQEPGQFDLAPLDASSDSVSLPQAAHFADKTGSGWKSYVLSFRKSDTYSPSLQSKYLNGLNIHSLAEGQRYSYFIKKLSNGTSFTTTNLKWNIQQAAYSTNSVRVRIIPQECADPANCPYVWDTSAWSSCDCTTSVQKRTVVCRNSTNANAELRDGWCITANSYIKPASTQSCACAVTAPDCPATGVWPSTPAGSVQRVSCAVGYTGTQTRSCDSTGVWSDPVTAGCIADCTASNGFPQTKASITVNASCGSGYTGLAFRTCTATGVWSAVNRTTCIADCAPQDGYAQTPAGYVSTIACAFGFTGTRSRLCSSTGAWQTENTSACVADCPADSGYVQTAAGLLATASCPVGYLGTRSRQCSATGAWLADNTLACIWIPTYCLADGLWPQTDVDFSAQSACPDGSSGMQVRTCNVGGLWSDADSTGCVADCSADSGYPATPAGGVATAACVAPQTGTRTRSCSIAGVWQSESTVGCALPPATCAATGSWPQTSVDTLVSIACGSGYSGQQTRTCLSTATWGTISRTACVADCAASSPWPRTPAGVTRTLACATGSTGTRSRKCSSTGVWQTVNTSGCVADCAASGVWPQTAAGSSRVISCAAGFTGTQVRACSTTGAWGTVDISRCVADCTADDGFPQTGAGRTASAACSAASSALRTRGCSSTGLWLTQDISLCPTSCEADDGFTSATAGQTVTAPCPANYTGLRTRGCGLRGIWEAAKNASCVPDCLADAGFPQTNAGAIAEFLCPSGFTGTRSRYCTAAGVWEASIVGNCVPDCKTDGSFSATAAGTSTSVDCPPGYTGSQTRLCDAQGVWQVADLSTCMLIPTYCPADGAWPKFPVGSTAYMDCLDNYIGTVTRDCGVDGTWEAPDASGCQAPAKPVVDSSIVAFVLIDGNTNRDLMTLKDGVNVNINSLGTSYFNVRADVVDGFDGTVVFDYNGASSYRVESTAPYALFGDWLGSYSRYKKVIKTGTVTIAAYATTETVKYSISFKFVNTAALERPSEPEEPTADPAAPATSSSESPKANAAVIIAASVVVAVAALALVARRWKAAKTTVSKQHEVCVSPTATTPLTRFGPAIYPRPSAATLSATAATSSTSQFVDVELGDDATACEIEPPTMQ